MQNQKGPKKKRRFNYLMQRANMTHVGLLGLIGAYFFYMAYRMLQNTRSGASDMSMQTTIILMIVMGVAGLAVWAYCGYVWYHVKKKSELSEEEAAELDREMARADLENYGSLQSEYETDVSDVVREFEKETALSSEKTDEPEA